MSTRKPSTEKSSKTQPPSRQRKTRVPCSRCGLHLSRCICEFIPRLDLQTQLVLVVHAKELKRTTNTGRLALEALVNSSMRVRGEDREAVDLSDLISADYQSYLLYPSEDALELSALPRSEKPVRLIVPDGNWRQAGKVHLRHPELAAVPRVKMSQQNTSQYHLRKEHMPEGMSTLEAIAHALAILEGSEVGGALMQLYQHKLKATLLGRGQTL